MCSPAASSKIFYRNSRLLRMAFLQLHRQQRADVFCDVILQAEGEAVPAHCCILSACSPFFMECLERQVPSQGCKVVLELCGLKIGILRKLVDFLYTSEMEVSREEAQEVLAAARQFQVAELESLQLQGGKLVKQVLGRRLNRECLQLPSAAPISARVVPQVCQPAPAASRTFCPLVAGKQHMAKPPADSRARANSTTSRAESTKRGVAAFPENGTPQLEMQSAVAPVQPVETGNVKTKSRSLGLRSAEPSEGCSADSSPLPRKIKLSRPKLLPAKTVHAAAGSATPTSIRRLWRQKTPGWDEAGELEKASPSCQAWSPPLAPKTSARKRSSSASASGSDTAPEEGPVGRVKLRKVVNGSCWEVVQEPPAREPNSTPVTVGETVASYLASPPSSRPHNLPRWPELPRTHAACSTELPLAKPEAAPLPEEVTVEEGPSDGRGGCRDPYELDVAALEPLSENEEFGDPAPLEQMLDLLLSGSSVEGLDVAGPGGTAGPSCGPNTAPLGATGEWCPPEVQLWPEWDDTGKGPLSGWETGGGDCAFSTEDGDASGLPACGHLTPSTLPGTQNPQHSSSAAMEDGPGSVSRSSPKHSSLASQPPDSVESDDEIDIVAGAEEVLIPAGFTCVKPDPSSESDNEVDILN
uniref:BTB domain containing 18 n=1 Tax=Pelusios castaneus TaxID=367368 RepID=A0A8C8RE79_9SAUR